MKEVLIALFTFVGYCTCCLTVGIAAGTLFWFVDTRWEAREEAANDTIPGRDDV